MKNTTNRYQRNYMLAKALVDGLKDQEKAIELAYIVKHKIVNPDGHTPTGIFDIDDGPTFDTANEAVAPEIDALEIYEAEKALWKVEDQLIEYALSIAPAKEREILRKPCFGLDGDYIHVDIREKVLGLALKLDASTVCA